MGEDLNGFILALADRVLYSEIKVRALTSLIINNDVATEEEFRETCEIIRKRDFEDMKKELDELIEKYSG